MNEDELKEYSPTIMGFASSLLDKLGINFIPAGRDTWHSTAPKEDTLTDLGGKPSNDTRTSSERNEDYLNSPYLRWKASMLNETNPLVGLDRTIGTALTGASAVAGIKSIPTVVKAFIRNPKNTTFTTAAGAITGGAIGLGTSKADKAIHGQPTFFSTLGNLYGFNVARQIVDPVLRATHFYKTFAPFNYNKDLSGTPLIKRGWNTARSILRGYPRNTDELPDYYTSSIEGFYKRRNHPTQSITPEGRVIFRDAAYRKYLGLPERPGHNLYLSNDDGTYRYNMDYVNRIRTINNGTEFDPKDFERWRTPKGNYGDAVTSNGGNLETYNKLILDDGTVKYSIKDDWDINPFKDKERSGIRFLDLDKMPQWFRNLEASGLMGNGKVFTLKLDFYE